MEGRPGVNPVSLALVSMFQYLEGLGDRAVADGARAGLRLLLEIGEAVEDYYPYHVARADLLRRSGQREAAADAYQRALELCQNQLERAYLLRRYRELGGE